MTIKETARKYRVVIIALTALVMLGIGAALYWMAGREAQPAAVGAEGTAGRCDEAELPEAAHHLSFSLTRDKADRNCRGQRKGRKINYCGVLHNVGSGAKSIKIASGSIIFHAAS